MCSNFTNGRQNVIGSSETLGFYGHLNVKSPANDAPANDVMYHNTCWVMLEEKVIKRELKCYGNWVFNFLGPTDVTNDDWLIDWLIDWLG